MSCFVCIWSSPNTIISSCVNSLSFPTTLSRGMRGSRLFATTPTSIPQGNRRTDGSTFINPPTPRKVTVLFRSHQTTYSGSSMGPTADASAQLSLYRLTIQYKSCFVFDFV
eukprot:GHVN01098758.1.p2 GENE.GHVN01098758.1~~GHVN01098758.1.p2  ORF type:complete len:111 (+),score=2.03 GHVN01098758.1:908-1240(+)